MKGVQKYFLNLEKERQKGNCIISLKDKNGISVFEDQDILHVATEFYSNLYKPQSIDIHALDNFFESVRPENTLNDELQGKCEGLFTNEECLNAINNIKRNKSPGLDGLTIEFYEEFGSLFGELVINVFNSSL